jgi:hypothetical protein
MNFLFLNLNPTSPISYTKSCYFHCGSLQLFRVSTFRHFYFLNFSLRNVWTKLIHFLDSLMQYLHLVCWIRVKMFAVGCNIYSKKKYVMIQCLYFGFLAYLLRLLIPFTIEIGLNCDGTRKFPFHIHTECGLNTITINKVKFLNSEFRRKNVKI